MHLYLKSFTPTNPKWNQTLEFVKCGFAKDSQERFSQKRIKELGQNVRWLDQWKIKELGQPIEIYRSIAEEAVRRCVFFEDMWHKLFPPEKVLYKILNCKFDDVIPFGGMTELTIPHKYNMTRESIYKLWNVEWVPYVNSRKNDIEPPEKFIPINHDEKIPF